VSQETDVDQQGEQQEPPQSPAEPNYYDQLLKLKAEFENYRKRVDREKPEFYKLGKADMLLKLLPVYDVLRKAHEEVQASHAQSALGKGMELIFKEFEKLFKDEGVTAMDPIGKPYDPIKHEVLSAAPKPGAADSEVSQVLQDGYMLGDRVLRTAKVCIVRNPVSEFKENGREEKK
jgi:molecular chaperone GrpE